jgi:hypothetical protein
LSIQCLRDASVPGKKTLRSGIQESVPALRRRNSGAVYDEVIGVIDRQQIVRLKHHVERSLYRHSAPFGSTQRLGPILSWQERSLPQSSLKRTIATSALRPLVLRTGRPLTTQGGPPATEII